MGAVVLLGIGIIGFPLVFQTQPRPIPVDIPIEIPNRNQAGALKADAPATPTAPAPPEPPAQDKPPDSSATPRASAAPAPVEVEVLPPARVDAETAKPETKVEPDKDRGRFVVQAGSYTDLDTVREVRHKLERLGVKTYTQAVVIDGVTRVRVRVGPFNSRQEAQDTLNKVKAAGVAASLLQL